MLSVPPSHGYEVMGAVCVCGWVGDYRGQYRWGVIGGRIRGIIAHGVMFPQLVTYWADISTIETFSLLVYGGEFQDVSDPH